MSLRLLVEVVDRRSIGAAARQLGISQPAGSERLAALERRLGVQLCLRGPTGIRPTPAGLSVREWAVEVLEAAERLALGVATLNREREGDARIAASLTIADYLMASWVHALRRSSPGASVRLEVANSAEVVRSVADGAADLGFVEGGGPPAGLVSQVIGADELVVVVTPAHPWAHRASRAVEAAELAVTPLVVREEGSGTRDVLERALRAAGRRAAGRRGLHGPAFVAALELGSTRAIKAAVLAGDGPGVVSALAVAEELACGDLVRIGVDDARLTRRLRAIWREECPPVGAAGSLLSIVDPASTAGCRTGTALEGGRRGGST